MVPGPSSERVPSRTVRAWSPGGISIRRLQVSGPFQPGRARRALLHRARLAHDRPVDHPRLLDPTLLALAACHRPGACALASPPGFGHGADRSGAGQAFFARFCPAGVCNRCPTPRATTKWQRGGAPMQATASSCKPVAALKPSGAHCRRPAAPGVPSRARYPALPRKTVGGRVHPVAPSAKPAGRTALRRAGRFSSASMMSAAQAVHRDHGFFDRPPLHPPGAVGRGPRLKPEDIVGLAGAGALTTPFARQGRARGLRYAHPHGSTEPRTLESR